MIYYVELIYRAMLDIRLDYIGLVANGKTSQVVEHTLFAEVILLVVSCRQNILEYFAMGNVERIYAVSSNVI